MVALMADPIVTGFALAIPATVISLLGLRRAYHNDKVTEQSGIVAGNATAVAQVISGLNQIIDNLQDDNRVFREEIKALTRNFREEVKLLNVRLEAVIKERDALRKECNFYITKYGDTKYVQP